MTVAEFTALVDQIEYRPGWRLTTEVIYAIPADAAVVLIHLVGDPIQSARDPYKFIRLEFSRNISVLEIETLDEAGALHIIFNDLILGAEIHEAKEHFQYRGTRPYDPHLHEQTA